MQRESQRVQKVLGEGPMRIEEFPERVRRGSIGVRRQSRESQETVQKESGEDPERVRRGCRECQRGFILFEVTVLRVKKGSKESQERVQRVSERDQRL